MNTSEYLPINKLLVEIEKTKGNPLSFEDLRDEIKAKDDSGNPKYYINMKENDDLFILYYDNLPKSVDTEHSSLADEIEKGTRSCIFEKKTLKPIATQFNRIIYNAEAKEFLEGKDWGKIVVEKCYEGTILVVYNHNDKWYISTRRCLDASESTWIKNKSYKEMFEEAIEGKFVII